MTELKMSITLPLVIILFVYGRGVYCPGILRPGAGIYRPEASQHGLRSSYLLLRCESHSSTFLLDSSPSITYEFEFDEAYPSGCNLIKRSEIDGTTYYPFEREHVNFHSMMGEEMRLTNESYRSSWAWSVTCYFTSATQAQQFYKLITRDRSSELVPFGRAEYLKNSNNIVLAEQPNLYSEGEGNVTIVVKNDAGDAVFILQTDTIDEITRYGLIQIELYIKSQNPGGRRLYKLGFSSPTQAAALIELIGELRQHSEDSASASE